MAHKAEFLWDLTVATLLKSQWGQAVTNPPVKYANNIDPPKKQGNVKCFKIGLKFVYLVQTMLPLIKAGCPERERSAGLLVCIKPRAGRQHNA